MYADSIVEERLALAKDELGWPLEYHSTDEVDRFTAQLAQSEKYNAAGQLAFTRDLTPNEFRFITNEKFLCACDAAYALTRYMHLADETDRNVRFKFRDTQKIYFNVVAELEAKHSAIELIIAKGRQQFVTTLTELLIACRVFFCNDVNALVASADRTKSEEMGRKVFYAYDNLPWWIRPKYSRRVESVPGLLEFDAINTRISVQHGSGTTKQKGAQKIGLGRGGTRTVWHVSEASIIPKPEQQIEAALLRSVHPSPRVFGVVESTFAGKTGWFAENYKFAKEHRDDGMSRLIPIFFSWPCAHDIYPMPGWIDNHPVPYEWEPTGKVLEQITKAELFISTDPLLSKHFGKDWTMPIDQQWFYNVGYLAAERTGTLSTWKQEMCCLTGDTRISTDIGIIRLDQAGEANVCESGRITKFIPRGKKAVYEVRTKDGRVIRGTSDHKFMTPSGWKELGELCSGMTLELIPPMFSEDLDCVEWDWSPLCWMSADITSELGRFLGYFMGDGCYHSDAVSIAVDGKDTDIVNDVSRLFESVIGKRPSVQHRGGLTNLRCGSIRWFEFMNALGCIQPAFHNNLGRNCGYKRKVRVPECIFRSPKGVVKQFLSALFECDAHANPRTPVIVFWSKYDEFLRDVQLLLLGFGIRSRFQSKQHKNMAGRIYTGRALNIPAAFVNKFYDEVGFISRRKQLGGKRWSGKENNNGCSIPNRLEDEVVSVERVGIEEVFDISVKGSHSFSANGIKVHNCDDVEAMVSSYDNVFGKEVIEVCHAEREKKYDVYAVTGQSIEERFDPDPNDIDYNLPRVPIIHKSHRGDTYRWELVPLRYDLYADATGEERELDVADAKLFIFKQPKFRSKIDDGGIVGRDFGIGVDSSTGSGSDASVISVTQKGVGAIPDVQAAELRSKRIGHVEVFAFAMPIALYFKDPTRDILGYPMVGIEQIVSVGDVCQKEMKRLGYPAGRFFNFGRYDTRKIKSETGKQGWFTTGWSRPILIGMFVHCVKNGWYILNSPWTIEECREFEVHLTTTRKEKWEHSEEACDDGIFGSAISTFILHDLDTLADRSKKRFRAQGEAPPPVDITEYKGMIVNPRMDIVKGGRILSIDDVIRSGGQLSRFEH